MPTITLHWRDPAGSRQASVVCEDSAPQALLPLLIAGCGLPTHTADGESLRYVLRTARPGRPALNPALPLSAQRIHDGAQLWLVAADQALLPGLAEPTRCLIGLLDDCGEIVVPAGGVTLDRDWLLRALALFDPQAYTRELAALGKRRSPLIYVSSRPHCRIERAEAGGWRLVTARDDVLTLVNAAPLTPDLPQPLADGDRIRLGAAGPVLRITLA